MSTTDTEVPQWKKDLIARLRNQNRRTATVAARLSRPSHSHPTTTINATSTTIITAQNSNETGSSQMMSVVVSCATRCADSIGTSFVNKMVQERSWLETAATATTTTPTPPNVDDIYTLPDGSDDGDSDSSEDLHYGPGIVSKLKNRYLSLALRETHQRASIVPMRKAASLENILDGDSCTPSTTTTTSIPASSGSLLPPKGGVVGFVRRDGKFSVTAGTMTTTVNSRYRRAITRGFGDMKRARSVETISCGGDDIPQNNHHHHHQNHHENLSDVKCKRESLHEDVLANAMRDCDKAWFGCDTHLLLIKDELKKDTDTIIAPYSHRTNRPKRIAPLMDEKEKPPTDVVRQAKLIFERRPEQRTKAPLTTGEVAAKVATYKNIIVQNKPIITPPTTKSTQSPLPPPPPPIIKQKPIIIPPIGTNIERRKRSPTPESKTTNNTSNNGLTSPIPDVSRIDFPTDDMKRTMNSSLSETPDLILTSSPILKPYKNGVENQNDLIDAKTSPLQPLRLEINGDSGRKANGIGIMPVSRLLCQSNNENNRGLTSVEIEKNLINASKTQESKVRMKQDEKQHQQQQSSKKEVAIDDGVVDDRVIRCMPVPKIVRKVQPEPTSNSIVFKFTDRKDVPDYVQNDRTRSVGKLEKPKVGEGGIILLPGASIDESFTDDDEEILRSLEAPPSPCDVAFINDNILIDGKSSLSQKTKKIKMRISFLDEGPEIYEYPSESSLLIDEINESSTSSTSASSTSPPPLGHTVPSLSGTSSLANYTPKSMEEFQPGVTRTNFPLETPAPIKNSDTQNLSTTNNAEDGLVLEDFDRPILFSAGTNSDILF